LRNKSHPIFFSKPREELPKKKIVGEKKAKKEGRQGLKIFFFTSTRGPFSLLVEKGENVLLSRHLGEIWI